MPNTCYVLLFDFVSTWTEDSSRNSNIKVSQGKITISRLVHACPLNFDIFHAKLYFLLDAIGALAWNVRVCVKREAIPREIPVGRWYVAVKEGWHGDRYLGNNTHLRTHNRQFSAYQCGFLLLWFLKWNRFVLFKLRLKQMFGGVFWSYNKSILTKQNGIIEIPYSLAPGWRRSNLFAKHSLRTFYTGCLELGHKSDLHL